MRLNPDCIRDILLTVEDNTTFGNFLSFGNATDYAQLSSYSTDEVLYHIKQCELSGLLTKVSWYIGGSCLIHDLSPYGHEFLANIRSNTNWNKTKEITKKVGTTSLNAIIQIASNVISELIKNQF